ncbi:MAG TPA: hypothetical protein PLV92_11380, partial [Pirellulaceae bacterium]|nr:hypothetical protein [Pirellulaceae bacterium]
MTKDGIAKLDKDTVGHLEALRKSGGARRFAMVCSGGAVASLVVYKKGSLDKYKNQAREGGTGQFYHGVVIG